MDRSFAETLMGAFVLSVAVFFGIFAYNASGIKASTGTYKLQAKFDTIDGIGAGNDVRIGGVKIGVVDSIDLDPQTYLAIVTLQVRDGIKLPKDSGAAIVSESLLGNKYIALTPGGEEDMLEAGGIIKYTQSSVNLESLIGRFMFSGDKGAAEKKE